MTRIGAAGRRDGSGIATTMVVIAVFASVTVNAVLFWTWFGPNDRDREASVVEAQVKLPSATPVDDHRQLAQGPLRPNAENRAAGSAPPATAGSPERAPRESDNPLDPHDQNLATGSASAPSAAPSGGRFPAPFARAQDSQASGSAAVASDLDTTSADVESPSGREPQDSVAPEIVQILFDRPIVGSGQTNVIRVEARDDRSGVASITGACQSPSRSALIWFTTTLNARSGKWEGTVGIPSDAECGEWRVQQVSVKDKAGNSTVVADNSPVLFGSGFQVAPRPDCDFVAPYLGAFDVSPRIVSNEAPTEVIVTATVNDEGSGAVSMAGWFDGPASAGGEVPRLDFRCSPVDPRDTGARWMCRVPVTPSAPKGTWKVGMISVRDKALNRREYTAADPVFSGQTFQVQ